MIVTDRQKEGLFLINGRVRKVEYLVLSEEVYFHAQESINWVNEIIEAITTEEQVHWSTYTFFDVQIGIPGDKSWYCMEEVIILDDRGSPYVDGHMPRAYREHGKVHTHFGNLELPGIPEEVQHAFGIH
jgi:hypothetical protein